MKLFFSKQIYMHKIKGDADLSLRDSNGLQLAHLAASKGHVDTLEYLHGIDIDLLSYDNNGRTPMHHAAQAGCRL